MTFKMLGPIYSPEAPPVGGGGAPGTGLSEDAQDLADLADDPAVEGEGDGGDDDPDAPDSDDEGDAEGEGEGAEGDEPEAEEGDEPEEDEAARAKDEPEVDATGRPTVKSVKAKYPDVFKDFPYLKRAFFELPKYQAVFADPQEAEQAASKAQEYDALESEMVGKGDPTGLLTALNDNNQKALTKVIENFGPALRKMNPDMYLRLTTPIVEELLYFASRHGDKTQNKNLSLAAKHIANYVFSNGGEIPDITRRNADREPSEDELQLQQDRQRFDTERHQAALTDVAVKASTIIDGVISNKLEGLTQFERKAIIRDTREAMNTALSEDAPFQRILRNLWIQAKRDSYSSASKERIKEAWLSRAKAVAPGIRNRLKQEALAARKGSGRGNSTTEAGRKRGFPSSGGSPVRGGGSRVLDSHKIDYSRTSDEDILSGDPSRVRLKK